MGMEPTPALTTTPTAEVPPDCEHRDWQMGCPRCFFEACGLAKGEIRATTVDAQMEGAILMNWHVLMVVADMETQLVPMTRSLELDKVRLAKELTANLKALRIYLIALGANPTKMEGALRSAAIVAEHVNKLQQKEQEQPMTPVSSIILTDRGAA